MSSTRQFFSKSVGILKTSCKNIPSAGRTAFHLARIQTRNFSRSCTSTSRVDVELTSVRYKDHVQRGNYATLQPDDIAFFRETLGENRVLTEESDVDGYNVDWLGIVRGNK